MLLMPSKFEPCGLSQMIAMRYGTLPIVRETGGLRDSVAAYNKFTGEGTGFSFANMNADEMADTLLGACEIFWTDKSAWDKLVNNAMSTDFSWRRAANDYMDIYHRLHPEIEVKTVAAEGLNECRQMLRIARTGKYDGYLLEGMACPGGCIAGAGTVQPAEKSRRNLERYKEAAPMSNPLDTPYLEDIHLVYENPDEWDRVGRH